MDLRLNAQRRNINLRSNTPFWNVNMESIISNSSESLRIIDSLGKTYTELRSMQIANDSTTYMLAGKLAWNTKSVRRSFWKREMQLTGIHHLKASLMWSLLHNPSARSSAWMLTSASCFRGRLVLDLQPRRVNRSAISSEAFAAFPLAIHWILSWNPPMPLGFQSKKPSLSLGIQIPWYGMDMFWNHPLF